MIAGLKPYPVMKDSGVEQLGKVPEHWNVRELGRIGAFFKGNGGTKEDEVADGVPCVRYGDLYTRHRYYIEKAKSCVSEARAVAYTPIRFGDVLFAGSGETIEEIGKSAVNLLDEPACCGGDVIVFRPSIDLEPRFLGLATDCPQAAYQKSSMGRGITVMHIYGSELKYLSIALPPAAEQAAIVRYLDHVDRRVRRLARAKRKLIALLNEQKQAIIHRAVTSGLDPGVPLKDSGVEWLGEVPAHWEVIRCGRVIHLMTGFPFKSEGFSKSEADIRLLRGVNISPGSVRWEDVVRWPLEDRGRFGDYELSVGDIVLGMDRPIISTGVRVASIKEMDLPSLLLQRVARIRALDVVDASFLLMLYAGKGFRDYLAPIFTGISVPHLSPEQIRSFCVTLPSLDEQKTIIEYLERETGTIDKAIKRASLEIAFLTEYQTRLTADVVTGKLDVREAAARLPAVDPLAADDVPDALDPDPDAEAELEELDVLAEEAEA